MKKAVFVLMLAAAVMLQGCGAERDHGPAAGPEPGRETAEPSMASGLSSNGTAGPSPSSSQPVNGTAGQPPSPSEPIKGTASPSPSPSQPIKSALAPDASLPGQIKQFLSDERIPNGDIYLQDGFVHVNVAGLNEEVEGKFAQQFAGAAYKLHDVAYTIEELLEAQQTLEQEDLYRKLNLYSSGVDVIANRLNVELPEESTLGVKEALEKAVDPGLLHLKVRKLGEPEITGAIERVDAERKRILILEPGQEQPTYWFSINEASKLLDENGKTVSFGSLHAGMEVRIWSTGAIMESLPALGSIRRLEIGAHE
ncbi:hypothetical protein ACE6ED_12070 [Paenibacillus sp. CN-4]|uniref:hypothetical protein n=1 Tax=Paenibacillus nanchangensis TaxID=3348343 RepID=UPI00397E5955